MAILGDCAYRSSRHVRACLTAAAITLLCSAANAAGERSEAPRAAGYTRCPGGLEVVWAPTDAAIRSVCEEAARARAFLAACGMTGRHVLPVRVGRSPALAQRKAAGVYEPDRGRIELLSFPAFLRVARARIDVAGGAARMLHASVVAHEIAHGVFYEHTTRFDLPETAHEYVAYVVQISTLTPEVRERLLAEAPMPPITSLFAFSFFSLRAAPERYAVAAWRHFNQPGNGCDFLRRVVAGEVHFPPPSD